MEKLEKLEVMVRDGCDAGEGASLAGDEAEMGLGGSATHSACCSSTPTNTLD